MNNSADMFKNEPRYTFGSRVEIARKVMKKSYIVFAALMLGVLSVSFSQSANLLHISQVMTSSELAETGISSLNEQQRKALDDWLNSYTRRVFKVSTAAVSGETYSGEGKHWVDETCEGGAIVVLEDDSAWAVESTDRTDTALWLATTDITVKKDSQASGTYKYILRNTEDKETAHAKYLGTL
jgi:hypothetical protein